MGMPSDGLRKQWDYDASGELVRTRHSRNGETRYRYDPAGHVLSATLQAAGAVGGASPALQQALHEVFHYDPAGNRLDAPVPQGAEGSRGWVRHNRVKVLQDKRYDYDGFGRLVRKRIGAHTELHCRYDALHRMTHASVIRAGRDGEPLRQVFRYRYDPLGRRIAKEDDFGATRFVWEGLRLLQESRGAQTSTYVYEPASYRPLARIDGAGLLEPEHPVSVLALAGRTREVIRPRARSVPSRSPMGTRAMRTMRWLGRWERRRAIWLSWRRSARERQRSRPACGCQSQTWHNRPPPHLRRPRASTTSTCSPMDCPKR